MPPVSEPQCFEVAGNCFTTSKSTGRSPMSTPFPLRAALKGVEAVPRRVTLRYWEVGAAGRW
jgi:hypothetical protein